MMRHILLCLTLCLLSTPLLADVVVEASLDSAAIRIGEQLNLHTRVTVPKGTRVIFPEYQQGYLTEGIEVLERSQVDTSTIDDGSRWVLNRTYVLTSFDSALYSLPPVEVQVGERRYASRNTLGLKVESIEVDTVHTDNIRDPYGPVSIPFRWSGSFVATSLLLWLFLVAFVVSLCRLLKHEPLRKRITIAPPPPAHQVALRAIEQFRGRAADSEDELKAYYDELTGVLRTYIKERFGIDAREMTTPQLITALTNAEDETALYDLRELLQTADLVKFARLQTSATENDRSLLHAMDYINQTKPTDAPPERIVKVVDVDLRRRRLRIGLRWAMTLVSGSATLAMAIYIIYTLVDTFR